MNDDPKDGASRAARIREKGTDLDYEQEALEGIARSWEADDPACQAFALADAQAWALLHQARQPRRGIPRARFIEPDEIAANSVGATRISCTASRELVGCSLTGSARGEPCTIEVKFDTDNVQRPGWAGITLQLVITTLAQSFQAIKDEVSIMNVSDRLDPALVFEALVAESTHEDFPVGFLVAGVLFYEDDNQGWLIQWDPEL